MQTRDRFLHFSDSSHFNFNGHQDLKNRLEFNSNSDFDLKIVSFLFRDIACFSAAFHSQSESGP